MSETEKQRLDVADVAKALRAEIKAAVKSGKLPRGLKASVTISRFSMGCSLSVKVTAVPAGFVILAGDPECPHAKSPAAAALLAKIEAMIAPYHRDDSDTMTDYFNVNFYKHVDFDGALEADEIIASRAA